jgi:hypothetical protein
MPATKLSLNDLVLRLGTMGPVGVSLFNGAATVSVVGPPHLSLTDTELVVLLGQHGQVRVRRDRIHHGVLTERDGQKGRSEGHLQLFDGNYDKVVALSFPDGLHAIQAWIEKLDGNDFEIG